MSALTIFPSLQYTTNEVLTATVLNAPIAAIQAWSTTIDNTNVGTAGFFASQLIPLNTAQSTFGGAVGYTFAPGSSTQVPLTLAGTAGQSVDLFDVTFTSGGVKAFGINSTGAAFVGVNAQTGAAAGDITVARSATSGALLFGSGTQAQGAAIIGSANALSFFPQSNQAASAVLTATQFVLPTCAIITGTSPIVGVNAGDGAFSRSTTQGIVWVGGASASYAFDGGILSPGNISFSKNGASIATINGASGVYTASDANLKTNIAPLPAGHGLATILSLQPSMFTWKDTGNAGLGFIAQDVQAIVPEAVIVMNDETGQLGLNQTMLIPYVVHALQDLKTAFDSYVSAHP